MDSEARDHYERVIARLNARADDLEARIELLSRLVAEASSHECPETEPPRASRVVRVLN